MKIAIINTYDVTGGAARAAHRLHKGLLQQGADSRMVVLHKKSDDAAILKVTCDSLMDDNTFFVDMAQKHYINNNRTDLSNTLFSLSYSSCDISKMPEIRDADVINLHWVADYQSPFTLKALFDLGKPVIWTLHDQWAFTGGCHYSAGCERYQNNCLPCPQLLIDQFELPAQMLKDRHELFKTANLTIVSPSSWMGRCAKQSALFKDKRIEVIPNGLETDLFMPIAKAEAKKQLNIREESVVLLIGAESAIEKRKGFQQMKEALHYCMQNLEFQRLISDGQIVLMNFGYTNNDLVDIGLPVLSLGHIDSDLELRNIYSAADIFILPSLEDNLPNTMLESLSCGTPIIAFQVGGITEVITHGVNGQIIPAFDTRIMADAILDLIRDPERRTKMGLLGRHQIANNYSQEMQAERYLTLFNELHSIYLGKTSQKKRPTTNTQLSVTQRSMPDDNAEHLCSQKIFLNVVLRSLKQEIDSLQQKLNLCEADNSAKTTTIYSLEQSIKMFQNEKDVLQNEKAFLQNEKELYQKHLETSELDRAARLDAINSLLQQKTYLESFNGAIKVVLQKILKKLRMYNFARRHKSTIQNIYAIARRTKTLKTDTKSDSIAGPEVGINSPLVEAFVSSRTLGGALDEDALVEFYELGSRYHNILCIQPGNDALPALFMLSRAGARILNVTNNINGLNSLSHGFSIYNGTLSSWLIERSNAGKLDFDCILLDRLENTDDVNMLTGRLQPNTGLLFSTALLDKMGSGLENKQARQLIGPFALYNTPPDLWIDPVPQEITAHNIDDWPLKAPRFAHPKSLPSGLGHAWPKISIVTVSYNQGHYIEETIRSVLLQGYPNLEYIVVDGGSTDSTSTILNRYRGELTHCISEKDKGQSDALNKGFRLATGDILAWLNSDDRYYPWTLWRVAQAFNTSRVDMIAGGCALIVGDQKMPFRTHHTAMPLGKSVPLPLNQLLDIDGSWQKGNFFYQPEVFWSRDLWERSGSHVDEDLYYSMDYELWLRMAQSNASILHIPDTLALFRIHENQKTSGDAPFLSELRRVSKAFGRKLK